MAQDTPKTSGTASPSKHQQHDKLSSTSHKKPETPTSSDSNTLTKKKSLVPAVFQKTLQSQTLKKQSRQRQEGIYLFCNDLIKLIRKRVMLQQVKIGMTV